MRAAFLFRSSLLESNKTLDLTRIRVTLYGSLAHTGEGHHTDRAVIWGLSGFQPDRLDPGTATQAWIAAKTKNTLQLASEPVLSISFTPSTDLIFDRDQIDILHPNQLKFEAFDKNQQLLKEATWLSIGGGFVATPKELDTSASTITQTNIPFPFSQASELLKLSSSNTLSIWALNKANEQTFRSDFDISDRLQQLWTVMSSCIERGLQCEGILPGGLQTPRRAAKLHKRLEKLGADPTNSNSSTMDWVHLWAMAVNEENAAGGQVVTAPTNGAAGVIPAVFQYYLSFVAKAPHPPLNTLERFFFTATAIGSLFKNNASISGAEVGCQGEVGTAASMAAAGLCELLGGNAQQIEHAAEIAIEHHLGLTCDPIGGLVQIPCIERNGFGAVKAISAARLAMHEDGHHRVTLDQAIETMRQTGQDMLSKYKETSLGGLAVNFVEC